MSLSEYLKNTRVRDLLKDKQPAMYVLADDKLGAAMEKLHSKNILSAPVWDRKEHKFIGVLDVHAVAEFIAFGPFFKQGEAKIFDSILFDNFTIEQVISRVCEAKYGHIIRDDDSLFHAVQVTSEGGLRRVFAIDTIEASHSPPALRVISQTDLVRHIWNLPSAKSESFFQEMLTSFPTMPIGNGVVTIKENEPTINGFKKMTESKVSAVAVLNSANKIEFTLSASDLRGLTAAKLKSVLSSPQEFLKAMNNNQVYRAITHKSSAKLGDVIRDILAAKVHRSFIVDSSEKPIAVVSFTDILSVIYNKML